MCPQGEATAPQTANVGLASAVALGIGGMIGAGLYSMLGIASGRSGTWLPLAFLVGAVAAAFSVYSYAKLGAAFPSAGGPANFTLKGYGHTLAAGGINVFQYLAYLIAAALYAVSFTEYMGALLGGSVPEWGKRAIGVGVVIVFALVNLLGTRIVGRAETIAIGLVVLTLIGFVIGGSLKAQPSMMFGSDGTVLGVAVAAGLLYVNFQGFGVVTNASAAMAKPSRELPRALFIALSVVTLVYLLVSMLVVMLVPLQTIRSDSGHVLADAGRVVAGSTGFVVVGVSALLATAAAVNATIFAASNVAADLANEREVSAFLARTVLKRVSVALFFSAGIVSLLVVAFPLSIVGQMASSGFLLVYAAITLGHIRIREQTGAKLWILVSAVAINMALFTLLMVDLMRSAPASAAAMAATIVLSFVLEWAYRRAHRSTITQGTGDDRPRT